jgi:hypothetical protein
MLGSGYKEIAPCRFEVVHRATDSLDRDPLFLDRRPCDLGRAFLFIGSLPPEGNFVAKTKLLTNMVHEIEAAAYRRGFNDGVRASLKAVKRLRPDVQAGGSNGSDLNRVVSASAAIPATSTVSAQPVRQLRENSDQMRVLKAIQASPGMRGVEILRALEAAGTTVHERTLRTALARLKYHHFIEQREERWYEIQAAGQSN